MNLIDAAILGLVQGLTEFFPISSSAHLKLVETLLGLDPSQLLFFDLVCHGGTLLALLVYLRQDIYRLLLTPSSYPLFALGLLPLVPAYFFLRPHKSLLAGHTGLCLIATGLFLLLALRRSPSPAPALLSRGRAALPHFGHVPYKWSDVLWIGLAQACALIPGISRSGATIGAGRLLGWSWSEAARFSFLLSIPAILGGHLLEGVKQLGAGGTLPWSALAVGCGAAALAGSVGVRAVFWAYERGKVAPFGYYCLALGLTWIIVAGQW